MEARRLALRRAPVAPDVAVLAAGDQDGRVTVADGLRRADRLGVHAHDPARPERVLRAVAELELDLAVVDEVELLLLVVEVARAGVAGREHERVDAERGHAERTTDLAKAGAFAEGLECRDGPAVARYDVVHRRN